VFLVGPTIWEKRQLFVLTRVFERRQPPYCSSAWRIAINVNWGVFLSSFPFFPFPPRPYCFIPFFSLPFLFFLHSLHCAPLFPFSVLFLSLTFLKSRTLKIQPGSLGKRCELLQRWGENSNLVHYGFEIYLVTIF